ncbi:hypothetical protein MAHJHV55_52310 [Mycobacterium avium subsp. hominissuis]
MRSPRRGRGADFAIQVHHPAHLDHPLGDLVAEVRRVMDLDCEVRAAAAAG